MFVNTTTRFVRVQISVAYQFSQGSPALTAIKGLIAPPNDINFGFTVSGENISVTITNSGTLTTYKMIAYDYPEISYAF